MPRSAIFAPTPQRAMLLLLLLALIAGMLLPVYTDEVGWRLQLRAAFDGVDKMYAEHCGPASLAVPPVFMWPVRWWSAFWNGMFPDPFWVRASGVGYALGIGGLLWRLGRRAVAAMPARGDRDRRRAAAWVTTPALALPALGLMPLLMVWSRPEQPLLLCTLGALLLALAPQGGRGRMAGVAALALVALSYHMKGVALAPLFLLMLGSMTWRAGNWRVGGALIAALIAATALAAAYWIGRTACPGDAAVAALYGKHSDVSELLAVRSAVDLWALVSQNGDLTQYFAAAAPHVREMAAWIVGEPVTNAAALRARDVARGIGGFAIGGIGLALLAGLWGRRWAALSDLRWTGALAILAMLFGWAVIQPRKSPYDAPFVLLLLGAAWMLAWSVPGLWRRALWLAAPAGWIVAAGAAASLAWTAATYGDALRDAARTPGYQPRQLWSISAFGYAQERPRIVAAAARCAIRPEARHHALLIDDMSYFAFMDSRLPQHWLGVTGQWRDPAKDPAAYLAARGSDGAILRCRYLTPGLRARALASGEYCCIPAFR